MEVPFLSYVWPGVRPVIVVRRQLRVSCLLGSEFLWSKIPDGPGSVCMWPLGSLCWVLGGELDGPLEPAFTMRSRNHFQSARPAAALSWSGSVLQPSLSGHPRARAARGGSLAPSARWGRPRCPPEPHGHPECPPVRFSLLEPACPRGGPVLGSVRSWRLRVRPGFSGRLSGRSLGRDHVEPKSEETSARWFLGFLFHLTKGLDHSQTGACVGNGSRPGGLVGAWPPASCLCLQQGQPFRPDRHPTPGLGSQLPPEDGEGRPDREQAAVGPSGGGSRFPESTGGSAPLFPRRGQVQRGRACPVDGKSPDSLCS